MKDRSEELAKRISRELGFEDWLWVEEAVRRRHRILFLRYEDVSSEEYEVLRDSIEADLIDAERAFAHDRPPRA